MLLDRIHELTLRTDGQRHDLILQWLETADLSPLLHPYTSGQNIILPAQHSRRIAVCSHFDTVPQTPGANDNAAAVVICMELAKRLQTEALQHLGVEICFFDQEEVGLLGSRAYLNQYGTDGYLGCINMELVGQGDQFALWPLNAAHAGPILRAFESAVKQQGVRSNRFDQIVMNTADHQSFREMGIVDSFTITCISDQDVAVAQHYYKAMEFDVDSTTLYEIIREAPIFEHYHQPTDTSDTLSEATVQMTLDAIWETLLQIDASLSDGKPIEV